MDSNIFVSKYKSTFFPLVFSNKEDQKLCLRSTEIMMFFLDFLLKTYR